LKVSCDPAVTSPHFSRETTGRIASTVENVGAPTFWSAAACRRFHARNRATQSIAALKKSITRRVPDPAQKKFRGHVDIRLQEAPVFSEARSIAFCIVTGSSFSLSAVREGPPPSRLSP
jgi:hypothetical protein